VNKDLQWPCSDSCNLVRDNATDADAAAAVDDPSRLTGQTKSL